MAQKPVTSRSSAEVVPGNATHIGRITKDSIIVITGSTYSFTVDTPEDSGLVSTNTTVKQLLLAGENKRWISFTIHSCRQRRCRKK
jgi:hypothetical protein